MKTENASHFLKGEPEALEEKKLDRYELIVAVKPRHKEMVVTKCPSCESQTVVWNIDDPYLFPGHETRIFQLIRKKVRELAGTI